MAKRTDFADYRYRLSDERQRLQDLCPAGMRVYVSLTCYCWSMPAYTVGISWDSHDIAGHGEGMTPALAFEKAKADLQKKYEDGAKTPRLVMAEVKPAALPPKRRALT